jgi:hypothetical protein
MKNKQETSKIVEQPMQPIVITKPTYDIEGYWISVFGDSMVVNYPDETKVKQAWEVFGQILGSAKAMKIQYETAGLKESSKKLDAEMKKQEVELEKKTLEIIGYPKLASYVITNLQSEATKIGKYLNQYSIGSYPHLPPSQCVDSMQKAKPFFDSFEVWAIEDKQLSTSQESEAVKFERAFKDPVIVGCKEVEVPSYIGATTMRKEINRYFIASWGDDIPLSQVLGNAPQIQSTNPSKLTNF